MIPRSQHPISRTNISENALKVLYRLKKSGYDAFLVGGSVRDLLLGREPKDFDVVTNAHPEEINDLFRNCRLIGRRFRLAHIRFGREIIEVATYRASHDQDVEGDRQIQDGMILRDNIYGTQEEDAWRRDFTVNALYYNIEDFSVVDYVGGMKDLDAGVLHLIGDTVKRFQEDPVRMLRAVRFAVKLGFRIHPDTEAPVFEYGHLLSTIPPARLFEEILKLFMGGCALQTFEILRHYGLFEHLFPQTEAIFSKAIFNKEGDDVSYNLLKQALVNTDKRIEEGKPVTPAFLFAALLWPPIMKLSAHYQAKGMTYLQSLQTAGGDVTVKQLERIMIPRRFSTPMREIWVMQARLTRTRGKRPVRLMAHPRFRAAYDFLLLRGVAGEDINELGEWWTNYQEVSEDERKKMTQVPKGNRKRKKDRM